MDHGDSTPPKSRGLTAIDGALSLIAILLIVQMWLLTATLESYLAGHHEAAGPGAVISGFIFLACAALYWFVSDVDHRTRILDRTGQAAKVKDQPDSK